MNAGARELAVTGVGVVSPRGDTAVRALTGTGAVDDGWFDHRERLGPRGYKYLPRAAQYVLAAARGALADGGVPTGRPALLLATNAGAAGLFDALDAAVTGSGAAAIPPSSAPYFAVNVLGNRPAAELGATGFALTVATERTAALDALATGALAVAAGRADRLLLAAVEEPPPGAGGRGEQGAVVLALEPAATARAARAVVRTRSLFVPPDAPDTARGRERARRLLAAALAELGGVPVRVHLDLDGSPVAGVVTEALAELGYPVTRGVTETAAGGAAGLDGPPVAGVGAETVAGAAAGPGGSPATGVGAETVARAVTGPGGSPATGVGAETIARAAAGPGGSPAARGVAETAAEAIATPGGSPATGVGAKTVAGPGGSPVSGVGAETIARAVTGPGGSPATGVGAETIAGGAAGPGGPPVAGVGAETIARAVTGPGGSPAARGVAETVTEAIAAPDGSPATGVGAETITRAAATPGGSPATGGGAETVAEAVARGGSGAAPPAEPPRIGCLRPALLLARAVSGPDPDALVVCATGTGQIALTRVRPAPSSVPLSTSTTSGAVAC
ncbi:hypothetical protein AB0O01_25265 [Streptomyces sp. NPDC093252]|uniref:hypothetical protein n=1 Tax=Streptomyces sp. NPDC093252 TaxID=3154980 RepID=UPI0034179D8A